MYCDLLPYAQWPLDFQSKKRIVSVETIWGNMVFYEKLYNATTDFDSKSDVWNDRKSLHDRFLIFWWVNFQSPTQKKIMYFRDSSRDATVQFWVVIFMSTCLPDVDFTKFAAGLWTIKDLCKFLVHLLQWTYKSSWKFLSNWRINFQSPTQKKIMYVRESSRDATVQLWVVIFMSAYLPDAGFTKFAAGLWTIKDLCKFLVYLLQWTYSLRGYVIYSEALNFIHLQFHEIFLNF